MYIIKKGIFIQGVYGPYESKEKALEEFQLFYKNGDPVDFDGYHYYYLCEKLLTNIGDSFGRYGLYGCEEIEYEATEIPQS